MSPGRRAELPVPRVLSVVWNLSAVSRALRRVLQAFFRMVMFLSCLFPLFRFTIPEEGRRISILCSFQLSVCTCRYLFVQADFTGTEICGLFLPFFFPKSDFPILPFKFDFYSLLPQNAS
jgi:hypothetical protein